MGEIAGVTVDGATDQVGLHLFEGGRWSGGGAGYGGREVESIRGDLGTVTQDGGFLERVLQLANIAGPGVGAELTQGRLGEGGDGSTGGIGPPTEETLGEGEDIVRPFA